MYIKNRLFFCFIVLFLLLKPSHSKSIWVSKHTGSASGPGSFQSPFDAVQDGIDDAENGDTVWVLPGSYSYRYGLTFGGKEIVLKSKHGPNATIFRSSFLPYLKFTQDENSNTVVDGFTIGPEFADVQGSSTMILVDAASPVLKNIIINGSSITAGFYQAYPSLIYVIGNASPVIDNCLFTRNNVGVGYGARLIRLSAGATPFVNKCTFADNRKTKYSGSTSFSSIFVDAYRMTNSIVYANTLPSTVSNPRWVDVIGSGGGVTFSDIESGFPGIGNISGNPLFYPGDYRLMPGSPCIDHGDPASPPDPDNTTTDMGFCYSTNWVPNLRFVYARDSVIADPGIDADDYVELRFTGAATFNWPAITEQNIDSLFPLDNNHTWLSGAGLIKSTEWDSSQVRLYIFLDVTGGPPTVAPGDTVDLLGLGIKAHVRGSFSGIRGFEEKINSDQRPGISIAQNFIDPLGQSLLINYDLSKQTDITFSIFDLHGSEIKTVHAGLKPAGSHTLIWGRDDNESRRIGNGIYFLVTQGGNTRQAQRIILSR